MVARRQGKPHTGGLRINEGTGGIRTANDIRAINTDCMRRRKPDSLRNVSMIKRHILIRDMLDYRVMSMNMFYI